MLKDILLDKIKCYIKNYRSHLNIRLDSCFDVYFLAQGEYNINFIVKDNLNKFVFRVNTGSQLQLENQIRYEYEALKRLETSGVTPRVFFVDDTKRYFDYGILIMEFLDGRHLKYEKDLSKAASIFAKIHALDLKNIDTSNFITEDYVLSSRVSEAERLLKEFLDSPSADIRQKRFFNAFLEWAKLNLYKEKYFIENKWHVINNTEVNSNNFIIGENKSFLIDWEKPVISDPCQDITQFLAPTTTLWKADYVLSSEEKNRFFKVYSYSTGIKTGDIAERVYLYNPFLYLRALSWCAFAYIEYLKPDKAIKNEDTLNKIKQYLEIDFMKSLLGDYFCFNN